MGSRSNKSLRALLAGSLLLVGVLTVSVLVGAPPATAVPVVQTIGVGNYPWGVSSDGTHVWVANFSDHTVTELLASDGSVVQTIGVGTEPRAVSSDGTHVWVADLGDNTVTELLASDGSVVRTIGVGTEPTALSSDGTHVWVANWYGTVSELLASDGSVVRTIGVVGAPWGISSDGTHVWVTYIMGHTVTDILASTGSVVKTIGVGRSPTGVSSDGAHVWVANSDDNTMTELLPSNGSLVQTIGTGRKSTGVSSDGAHVWVTNSSDNTVSEISIFAIVPPYLPPATPGTPYGPVTLQAVNLDISTPPYITTVTWSKQALVLPARALPPGMTLSSTGVLAGTPRLTLTAGLTYIKVKATESVTTVVGVKPHMKKITALATVPIQIS